MGFWRWYDRAARIDFAGTLLGIFFDWKTWAVWAGGTVVSLFISSYGPWTPGQAWLAALIGGACIAIIYIALSLFVYQLRSQRRSSLAKPEDVDGRPKITTPEPDIDARVAFFEILKSSQWRLDQTPDTRDRLAVVLDREIHNLLAQSKLKAWGEKNLAKGTGPLREIAASEWEEIEILFDEIQPNRPRTDAQYRVPRSHGSSFAYLGIKFSKEQVFSRFPPAAPDQPNWRIDELFSHIDPNVLNPSDAGRDPWEVVGGQIRDALSLRRLRIWGRPVEDHASALSETEALREIDATYWQSATFTYWFFDSTAAGQPHTHVPPHSGLLQYTDLRVNRAEALKIWPLSR